MSTSIRRLDPKKTVLLVCDLQTKFSELLFCHGACHCLFNDKTTGNLIYGFEEVVATATKMFKIAKVSSSTATVTGSINHPSASDRYLMSPSLYLNNIRKVRWNIAQMSRDHNYETTTGLGPTVPELNVNELGPLHLGTFDKTLFSMIIPQIDLILKDGHFKSVLILGIEVRVISMQGSNSWRFKVLIGDRIQSHVCVFQTVLDLLDKGYDVHVLADGVSSGNKEEVPIAIAGMRQAGARITTSDSCSFQLMGKFPFRNLNITGRVLTPCALQARPLVPSSRSSLPSSRTNWTEHAIRYPYWLRASFKQTS